MVLDYPNSSLPVTTCSVASTTTSSKPFSPLLKQSAVSRLVYISTYEVFEAIDGIIRESHSPADPSGFTTLLSSDDCRLQHGNRVRPTYRSADDNHSSCCRLRWASTPAMVLPTTSKICSTGAFGTCRSSSRLTFPLSMPTRLPRP